MSVLRPFEMRVLELNSIALGVPTIRLMEAAGASVAWEINKRASKKSNVTVFAGRGGNGGDGIVAARHLVELGHNVTLILTFKPREASHPDTAENLKTIMNMKDSIELRVCTEVRDYEPVNTDFVVDAILGVGVKGKLREPVRTAIKTINESKGFKVAVDVPSGLNPETGEVSDLAVKADLTVTMHALKPGLLKAPSYTGEIVIASIGIPPEASKYVGPGDVEVKVPLKPPTAHKGVGGRVLIVGGSKLYTGAPALAALSALRSGADLTVIIAPEKAAYTIASYSPNLIVEKVPGDSFKPEHTSRIIELSKNFDSIIVGPGVGRSSEVFEAILNVVETLVDSGKRIVVDADGLKALATFKTPLKWRAVLTPHAVEASMLANAPPPKPLDLEGRVKLGKNISRAYEATVVLKGPIDVIVRGDAVKFNRTGNQGMSVGGTGDVLSGIIGALIARGLGEFEAAGIAAYICGLAGDLVYIEKGEKMLATDLIEHIPSVFREPLQLHLKVAEFKLKHGML